MTLEILNIVLKFGYIFSNVTKTLIIKRDKNKKVVISILDSY